MSAAEGAQALDWAERDRLLAGFADHPAILIALSGGPDSTALAWLAASWRAARPKGPKLVAATVDHGLRPASAAEAEGVARWCAELGLAHRILSWQGPKPACGLQAAARTARYDLLLRAARECGATALAVAHTLDDQAETVLFRLARGSGVAGLAAMRPVSSRDGLMLLRPLLGVSKARLEATATAAGVPFVRDPSNADPRFTRARLRRLAPVLAAEGLDARRLDTFARRMARAEAALEAASEAAFARHARLVEGQVSLAAADLAALPEEIALRLLGRAVALVGTEGPVELGKLEDLAAAVRAHEGRGTFRRTLAGALVAIRQGMVTATAAPPRRGK